MRLCQFKNVFGEPGKGLHNIRLFDIAIVDVIMTFIGARIIQYLSNDQYTYMYCLIALFILGILLHELFCVETTVNKFLFQKD